MYIRNSSEERFAFLRWYFNLNSRENHSHTRSELKRYYDWSIIGVNHEDIVSNDISKYTEARDRFLNELSDDLLFRNFYETAYRWLIRQNIRQDNLHNGRKFNFEIERDRSLEHVYPKSKIGHRSEEGIALDWGDNRLDTQKEKEIKLWREEMKWKSEGQEYSGSEHCLSLIHISEPTRH